MPPVLPSLLARLPSNIPLEARNPVPTQTTNSLWTRILEIRQTTTTVIPQIIPTTYGSINSGPAPGTVVGIVLGSVAGFLLLLWLIYTCLNFGTMGAASTYTEEVFVAGRERRKSHRGSHRSSRRHSETVEVRRDHTPVRIVRDPSPRRETIIVEEHREERRAPLSRRGSDEVVVIEEHSPPRRKKSHRNHERVPPPLIRDDIESGFRTVDPSGFGGVVGGNRRSGSRRRYE